MLPERLKRFRKREKTFEGYKNKQAVGKRRFNLLLSGFQRSVSLCFNIRGLASKSPHVRKTLVIVFHRMKYNADFLSA